MPSIKLILSIYIWEAGKWWGSGRFLILINYQTESLRIFFNSNRNLLVIKLNSIFSHSLFSQTRGRVLMYFYWKIKKKTQDLVEGNIAEN